MKSVLYVAAGFLEAAKQSIKDCFEYKLAMDELSIVFNRFQHCNLTKRAEVIALKLLQREIVKGRTLEELESELNIQKGGAA